MSAIIPLNSDFLIQLSIYLMLISPIISLIGLVMAIASKKNKKTGIKLLIGSSIVFIIGFGTCVAAITNS